MLLGLENVRPERRSWCERWIERTRRTAARLEERKSNSKRHSEREGYCKSIVNCIADESKERAPVEFRIKIANYVKILIFKFKFENRVSPPAHQAEFRYLRLAAGFGRRRTFRRFRADAIQADTIVSLTADRCSIDRGH